MRICRCLLVVIVALVARPSLAQDLARMEELIQSHVHDSTFMGSVLVARDAEIILNKGYGFANVEWQIPNAPATKFRLGSLTKQFTSASILLLAERGKLSLEDPVRKYLTDAPSTWDAITIFHLLTHTSGIFNYTALPDFAATMPLPLTPPQIIAKVRDRPLDFEPGSKMSYSNSGYIVLGLIIEKVSGDGYGSFVQKNLFDPIGMKDSGYDSSTTIIARRAAGYRRGANGLVNAEYLDMSLPYAAGALYSTTEDLLRWEQALFGGKVLKPASLEKMTTPFKNDYALGVSVRQKDGRRIVEHNGGINGFNTFLAFYPESHVTVAVLGNLNGETPETMGAALGTLAHGGSVQLTSERREIALPKSALEPYVGTFQLRPGVDMTVSLDGGHLMVQLTGQPKFELFAERENFFFLKAVDAQLEFTKDAAGAVTAATLHQGSINATAPRK